MDCEKKGCPDAAYFRITAISAKSQRSYYCCRRHLGTAMASAESKTASGHKGRSFERFDVTIVENGNSAPRRE